MSVLTTTAPLPPALPQAAGPSCTLQRVAPQGAPGKSASLWQLGIEAQELTSAIGLLAQRLESDDPDERQQALAELEAALLADEGNKAAIAAKADALEDSLVLVLTRLQPTATRFSFPNHELSSRKSQAVEIENEALLDPEWLCVKTTFSADKTAIKAALKAGQQIAGAQLVSRRSWRIH